ncbi:RdgB/HAM1 family non-canonical purine NTP pyrophosphatase [Pleionea sp. CnH1-48]|uniref:RdgB/HAM1 family non-canonical purine NTP pyrophosphatase n=1 Tax=Pleionea sp. CnH1-48 TaxID=2954494 RepID=UPI00209774B1|nr:RdgB/HAM1 family non-canonical purine NTP pyrophosphatase [Pleionea sp. CnH1-48]MCO7225274.1 RdgB/HAM1 family non-canonical purine NTP pyrophosphatase [Pleionea sp. CnH1-48]
MSNKIVLASGNQKKIQELQDILAPLNYEIVPQGSLNIDDAVEDGLSFVENAIKKARHAAKLSGLPALADDSGIEVDAINGQPGIYSARFSGDQATDQKNNEKLLSLLKDTPEADRTARFQCVIVYMRHAEDPTPIICQGSWEGRILKAPQGDSGFGYDPLFYVSEHQCSAAELSKEQKHALSHRGKALALLKAAL